MPTFSDVNLFLGQNANSLVFDEDAINQNILQILLTPIKSKWYRPRLGSNIPSYLFDPVDSTTAARIKSEIEYVLPRNSEYRIVISSVTVIAVPDDQLYYVSLEYTSPYLDGKKIKFSFNLLRPA
jgi:phage baseplate assembly protein W